MVVVQFEFPGPSDNYNQAAARIVREATHD
jgi:hypothetical protein